MRQRYLYFTFFLSTIFLLGCEVINPDEGIPVIIKIDKIRFDSNPLQGTDSVPIQDVWVYLDGEIRGAYELPASIPLLMDGSHKIELMPGIILNGIAGTRSISPFFTTTVVTADFSPGQTYSYAPTSFYKSEVKLPWNNRGEEDFEIGGVSFDTLPQSSAGMSRSQEEVFEGNFSGCISMNSTENYFVAQSNTEFVLPKNGSGVVLEMHIKNPNAALVVGMYITLNDGTVISVDHLTINSGAEWRKLYINFTEMVSYYTNAKNYRLTLKSGLPSGQVSAKIYIDNIKLVHF